MDPPAGLGQTAGKEEEGAFEKVEEYETKRKNFSVAWMC